MSEKFAPNPVVGYRLSFDWYSVNVVEVKRRGQNSKDAGEEYLKVLAYCKNVTTAADWLFHHVIRARGSVVQSEAEALAFEKGLDKSVADMSVMLAVVEEAKIHVLAAVAELQATISNLNVPQKEIVKALGASPGEQQDVEPADAQ